MSQRLRAECLLLSSGLRWRSERRSISLHPSENGGRSRRSRFLEVAQIGMFNLFDSSTTFSMSQTGKQDLVVPLEEQTSDIHWISVGGGNSNSKKIFG